MSEKVFPILSSSVLIFEDVTESIAIFNSSTKDTAFSPFELNLSNIDVNFTCPFSSITALRSLNLLSIDEACSITLL